MYSANVVLNSIKQEFQNISFMNVFLYHFKKNHLNINQRALTEQGKTSKTGVW